jgi:hypothetical protein
MGTYVRDTPGFVQFMQIIIYSLTEPLSLAVVVCS